MDPLHVFDILKNAASVAQKIGQRINIINEEEDNYGQSATPCYAQAEHRRLE